MKASLARYSPASAPGATAGRPDAVLRWQPYADVAPALISDAYYCLSEYCKDRRLAVDPRGLPLSGQLTDDARAVVIEVLERDSVPRRRGSTAPRRVILAADGEA